MADQQIKEVKVSLSDQDVKAMSRANGTTRRRRRKTDDAQEGGAAPLVERVVDGAPILTPVSPQANQNTIIKPPEMLITPINGGTTVGVNAVGTVAAPAPSLSTVNTVGGDPDAVKIGGKRHGKMPEKKFPLPASKGPQQESVAAPVAAKIVPTKKRISAAPAASTLKKPKILVPVAVPPAAPQAAPQPPKKRKFTERQIRISVKHAVRTRKQRKHLKDRIASMPIDSVKKILLRKGILKPKASMPPDDMMRGMLRDYLLLHTAE